MAEMLPDRRWRLPKLTSGLAWRPGAIENDNQMPMADQAVGNFPLKLRYYGGSCHAESAFQPFVLFTTLQWRAWRRENGNRPRALASCILPARPALLCCLTA